MSTSLKSQLAETAPAAADLSSSRYKFVTMNTSGAMAIAANNTIPSGILANSPKSGEQARWDADTTGHLQIVLEGTVAIGDLLVVGTSGGALKATTGQKVVGIAKIAGASGDVGEIFFRPWLGTAP